MQGAFYRLFEKSNADFSAFLHHKGYGNNEQYRFKLFTFSRITPFPYHTNQQGFFLVKKIEFLFSTASDKNLEHLMHGIFPQAELILRFKENISFQITQVELVKEPEFIDDFQKFICLSPIVVSTQREISGKIRKYYLNYFKTDEKELWMQNLKTNLLRKYEILSNALPEDEKEAKKQMTSEHNSLCFGNIYENDVNFQLEFDPEYITTAGRSIKKLVKINNTSVIGLFAPFSLKCPAELKKLAYNTGLGEQNSAGFGCVDLVEEKL
jgi:CRISPR-associated endoribonuclease Cas6